MNKTVLSLTLAGPALAYLISAAQANEPVCAAVPAEATAVETAIIYNQCQILEKLDNLVPRVTAVENKIKTMHPAGDGTALIGSTGNGNGYVVFNPGNGTTTGGNPCSGEGLLAQSCNNHLQELIKDACWDGKCGPLFAPRVNDTTPLWKDYLTDGTAKPLDWSKLSTQMLATPGAVTMNGDSIILNMDGFLDQTKPADMTE